MLKKILSEGVSTASLIIEFLFIATDYGSERKRIREIIMALRYNRTALYEEHRSLLFTGEVVLKIAVPRFSGMGTEPCEI